jgi:hypothetical protein
MSTMLTSWLLLTHTDAHLHHPQQGPSCLNLRQTSKIHCNHHVCPFSIPTKISLHVVNESNYLLLIPWMWKAYCSFSCIQTLPTCRHTAQPMCIPIPPITETLKCRAHFFLIFCTCCQNSCQKLWGKTISQNALCKDTDCTYVHPWAENLSITCITPL